MNEKTYESVNHAESKTFEIIDGNMTCGIIIYTLSIFPLRTRKNKKKRTIKILNLRGNSVK
jgi:hypothetical protein